MARSFSVRQGVRAISADASKLGLRRPAIPLWGLAVTVGLALMAVFLTEWIARGSLSDTLSYLASRDQPAALTIGAVFLALAVIDASIGRHHKAILILLPVLLLLAVVDHEKQHYLTDPLYPSDLLFTHQILELMPVLVKERPGMALGLGLGAVSVAGLVVWSWVFAWRRFPKISWRARALRLAIALPLLGLFAHMMDYNKFFWIRDRLQAVPMMWDQKENYRHNGFILAYLFNLPMAQVSAPAGYMKNAIAKIPVTPVATPVAAGRAKPDIIVVMSESFWDPTRLPGVTFATDPMPFIRSLQSGHMFSPEFGGLTANIEFEAITGYSNAFLPYGSIPYQQYIRKPLPSMPVALESEGYTTRAIHPFQNWFWNRSAVYKALGFQSFRSEENMPPMPKAGNFATDEALMKEVMRQGDNAREPFYFYTVTLQGHGPYEPHRYAQNTVAFDAPGMPERDKQELATYAEGVKQADASFKMLVDWARNRPRETIIVFFGDHLPPLGNAYVSGGYMNKVIAERRAPPAQMKREHETPLVIWSSKRGPIRDIGTISPSLIPYHIARLAGLEHPYYTGLLGEVAAKYNIVDRYMLEETNGAVHTDWARQQQIDETVKDYRFIQHDIMFGKQYSIDRFFPTYANVMASGT